MRKTRARKSEPYPRIIFHDCNFMLQACNGMGNDPFVDAAESTSFHLPGTGKREGGEKMQPLHRFSSRLGTVHFMTPKPDFS